jgi:hypothetical protein
MVNKHMKKTLNIMYELKQRETTTYLSEWPKFKPLTIPSAEGV